MDVGSQLRLTPGIPGIPGKPAPEQFTDPAAPAVQLISSHIKGLSFKGVGALSFARTQADPTDASLLIGNYNVKVVVFGSAADAKKFRDADAKEVIDRPANPRAMVGPFQKVGTYAGGVVLDDTQGHINAMFTIGNVAVDIRTGIAENAPGDGAKDIKKVADAVVANSKKK